MRLLPSMSSYSSEEEKHRLKKKKIHYNNCCKGQVLLFLNKKWVFIQGDQKMFLGEIKLELMVRVDTLMLHG